MGKTTEIRDFGYRSLRYPFPKMVNVEIPQGVSCRVIGTHGIDISVDGIAVSADVEFDPSALVTLAIPLLDGSMAKISGQVLCQTDDYCRFRFVFASGEQWAQVKDLISKFTKLR